ncbi:MAG TPA: MarR family transcriptional regulator [Methanoregulaceae archaeon]|nr:MarR family transcriptional regulator [Methanoregulaceae archaeon]
MRRKPGFTVLILAALLLAVPSGAADIPAASTTYTVTVQEDGSALWQIEYRTPLATDGDLAAFNNYTRDLPNIYIPQVQDLIQRSAAQASVAATRPMAISNVSGNTVVQTSPTGRYGVVIYSFSWSGFAEPDGTLAVGDAFAGGLYLARDSTLILRYPSGWTVTQAEPAPDDQRDGLAWYGLRSFGPGEPRITIEKSFPVVPVIAGIIMISLAAAGFLVYFQRKRRTEPEGPKEPEVLGEPAAIPRSAVEESGLEDRITAILTANGGEVYQSEIVRHLGIPKSTVSAALNNLHQQGLIQKVRKGRENLIRLVQNKT